MDADQPSPLSLSSHQRLLLWFGSSYITDLGVALFSAWLAVGPAALGLRWCPQVPQEPHFAKAKLPEP